MTLRTWPNDGAPFLAAVALAARSGAHLRGIRVEGASGLLVAAGLSVDPGAVTLQYLVRGEHLLGRGLDRGADGRGVLWPVWAADQNIAYARLQLAPVARPRIVGAEAQCRRGDHVGAEPVRNSRASGRDTGKQFRPDGNCCCALRPASDTFVEMADRRTLFGIAGRVELATQRCDLHCDWCGWCEGTWEGWRGWE